MIYIDDIIYIYIYKFAIRFVFYRELQKNYKRTDLWVIRHIFRILKLSFTGEETARVLALERWSCLQLRLNGVRVLLVNNSWLSYYRSSSLKVEYNAGNFQQ